MICLINVKPIFVVVISERSANTFYLKKAKLMAVSQYEPIGSNSKSHIHFKIMPRRPTYLKIWQKISTVSPASYNQGTLLHCSRCKPYSETL